jgi:Lrp/AsnC family leucine-responsive transcriptional regulator
MPVAQTKKVQLNKMIVDALDLKILELMRPDARISLTHMSKKLGISKSAVKYRVDRLTKLGIIKSFFTLVDSAVYGINLSVLFDLTVEQQVIQDIAEKLASYPEVIRVYELSNSPELHVHALFEDNAKFEHFIRNKLYSIQGIKVIKSGMIMKRYKTELTLTI